MAMKMNKRRFINELELKLSYSENKCIIICKILESNFFISKKNKDKIIYEFIRELEVSHEEAIRVYGIATKIINDELKNKLRHPFRSKN